jgi:hypothetical protein
MAANATAILRDISKSPAVAARARFGGMKIKYGAQSKWPENNTRRQNEV